MRKVNPDNRTEFISDRMDIEAYTKYTFPGRKGKYSGFIWDWHCFSGVDKAEDTGETAIFSIQTEYGEGWEEMLDGELGNYDYLMFDDIETRNPAVRQELKDWGKWYLQTAEIDGFRSGRAQTHQHRFHGEGMGDGNAVCQTSLRVVGEYWQHFRPEPAQRVHCAHRPEDPVLFDTILHMNFHQASVKKNEYDLRTIFDGTLVQTDPFMAVTLVDNHDTQPLQALEIPGRFTGSNPWLTP